MLEVTVNLEMALYDGTSKIPYRHTEDCSWSVSSAHFWWLREFYIHRGCGNDTYDGLAAPSVALVWL